MLGTDLRSAFRSTGLVIAIFALLLLCGTIAVKAADRRVLTFWIGEPFAMCYMDAPPISLVLRGGGTFSLNGRSLDTKRLTAQADSIYSTRPAKLLYLDAEPQVAYQEYIDAIVLVRGLGVTVVVDGRPPRCTSWEPNTILRM